ncbi:MAG: GNAT family N-acetyltransferase [Candidatus Promineifilaceae bacterium]|nr:GNAT family N-acetyltransferase [Candidatus Promineifilaceae bacterium]
MAEFNVRPVKDEDYQAILEVADAAVPFDPRGNRSWLRSRQAFDDTAHSRRHYVLEEDGQIIGYGGLEQQGGGPHRYRLYVVTAPERLEDAGSTLFERLRQAAIPVGARTLWVREYARDEGLLDFFRQRGFAESGRVWDYRLPVEEARLDVFLPRVAEALADGVSIVTLDSEGADILPALFDLVDDLWPVDRPALNFEQFRAWLSQPDILPEAYFIACRDDACIGHSVFTRSADEDDWLIELWTATRPKNKRQGVTLALRIRGIQFARRNDYKTVVTYTDAENFTTIALNEKLGFRRAFGYVTLELNLDESY